MRLAEGVPPTLLQAEGANTYSRLLALNRPLYITQETQHVLQLRPPIYASRILGQTQALQKGVIYAGGPDGCGTSGSPVKTQLFWLMEASALILAGRAQEWTRLLLAI